jgi:hypothetical protein
MLDESVVSAGLKLNQLAKLESGAGVILLTLKDAGKKAQGITYSGLREAVEGHLARRLERFGIKDPQPRVDALLVYLRDYQSVFTMAAR